MSKILLIGCGKQKLTEPAVAADLYTGPLFRSRREYAEATGLHWWIISAKYGLVEPDTWLKPYDATMKGYAPVDRSAWCLGVVMELLSAFQDDVDLRGVDVELHAGAQYSEQLRDVIVAAGMSYSWPVQGMGIGEQRQWYKRAAATSRLTI